MNEIAVSRPELMFSRGKLLFWRPKRLFWLRRLMERKKVLCAVVTPVLLWTSGRRSFCRPTVQSMGGCLDGLTAVATIAHELSWTSVLQHGPPPLCWLTVRDCVPSKYRGYTIWPHRKCLHALYPTEGKWCFIHWFLAEDTPWVLCRGPKVLVALPRRAVTFSARCCQGHLARTLGLGCC